MFTGDLITLLPELILAVGAMVLLLVGAFAGERSAYVVTGLAAGLLIVAGAAVATGIDSAAFDGALVVDGFARFTKILILLGSALALVMAQEFFDRQKSARFELPVLVVLATLGMLLMVSAANFLALYMGLELQSLALYVLAAFNRDNLRSSEAGLKYFVLGALSSGMLLYGISLIYGFTGTTEYFAVMSVVTQSGVGTGVVVGLVFLLAGLAFKVGAVPFHMWTPDVYEGAPTPVTAYFSTAAKVAAFAMLIRAILEPFPMASAQWQQIVIVVSVLSMALGAIAAIGQGNIKRLLAYSSIGHVGYALLGLAANNQAGVQGMLVYLAFYLITNLGAFVCVIAMRRDGQQIETISDLSGLARTQPKLAFAFSAIMLSLAGLPPLAGIFAKVYVFLAAVQAGLIVPAVLGVLASVVGAYYYLRIVKIIYFDDPAPAFDTDLGWGNRAILTASAVFSVLFVFLPMPLIDAAGVAAASLFP